LIHSEYDYGFNLLKKRTLDYLNNHEWLGMEFLNNID